MISYKPFLKLLIDRNLKKQDLVNSGVLSWATMAKVNKDENISLEMIDKICSYLKCQPGDIMEHIPVSLPNPVSIDIKLLKVATIQTIIPYYFTAENAADFMKKHRLYKPDNLPALNYDGDGFVDFINEQLSIACVFSDQDTYYKLTYSNEKNKYHFND